MRLADVEDKDFLSKIELNFGPTVRPLLKKILSETTTIDAVPVTRCKDCKYAMVNGHHPSKPLVCGMTRMCGTTPPEWFCADGARRDDNG